MDTISLRQHLRSHAPAMPEEALDRLVGSLARLPPETWRDGNTSLAFAFLVAERADLLGDAWLAHCHVEDLWLAFASARGVAAALASFDALLRANVRQHVASIDPSPDFVDEVCQDLRTYLLVPAEGGVPRLLAYEGRGPLGGWLRVAAVRRALNLRRDAARAGARALETPEFAESFGDPAVDYMRQKYASEVHTALEEAIVRLTIDERNVLRMHFLDGLGAEQIALAYGVHRTTITRWIGGAREAVLEAVRRRLRETLGLSESETESVLRLVATSVDLSIERLLRTQTRG